MKNKGFTLIELLAVIVILAIIALIATPIILNIIENAREESNKRSVELYAKAVENAVAQAQLNNTNANILGLFTPSNGGKTLTSAQTTLTVEYDGNVECTTVEINEKGNVYLAGCTVNNGELNYIYDGDVMTVPTPVSFAEDDWSTIVANVKAGKLSAYKVGDTKEVTLDGFGTYTVRIANTTTPTECSAVGFSQTACGFVIEFEDIIITRKMNSTAINVGGWKDSEMREYVNDTIYESLPSEIKENIIDTYVVSGYGSTSGETNFATTDKLYLLSTKEVWGEDSTNQINDTAEVETRQLDYYKSIGVTVSNYKGTIKKYEGTATSWWLRSANSDYNSHYHRVSSTGIYLTSYADNSNGVVVAFRIK